MESVKLAPYRKIAHGIIDRGWFDDVPGDTFADVTNTNVEQFAHLLAAFDKFVERNAVRQDAWRRAPLEASVNNAQHKLGRLIDAIMVLRAGLPAEGSLCEAIEDDAVDLINYVTFILRHPELKR